MTSMASPIKRDESTPASTNFGSERDWLETPIGTDVQTTPDLAASSGHSLVLMWKLKQLF